MESEIAYCQLDVRAGIKGRNKRGRSHRGVREVRSVLILRTPISLRLVGEGARVGYIPRVPPAHCLAWTTHIPPEQWVNWLPAPPVAEPTVAVELTILRDGVRLDDGCDSSGPCPVTV